MKQTRRQRWKPRSQPTLLELCQRHGLALGDDFVVWPGIGAVPTEAGQRRLIALAEHNPALARLLDTASGQQVTTVLQEVDLSSPRALRRSGRTQQKWASP